MKCNSTYYVTYKPLTKGWSVRGYHEYRDEEQTHEYNNQKEDRQISLWGNLFKYQLDKTLHHEKYGKVGEMRFHNFNETAP